MKFVESYFLWLTSRTYPYGSEYSRPTHPNMKYGSPEHIAIQPLMVQRLINEFDFKFDDNGNLYRIILNDNVSPTTMFTAHTDTVLSTRRYKWMRKFKLDWGKSKIVNHIFSKTRDFIKTDGKTTLGADDKAGLAIILDMIRVKKPGVYYLFRGEEVGLIGSSKLRDSIYENTDLKNVTKCLSLDRKGYNSVVTHQRFKRTCSDDFAIEVCKKLNRFGFWFAPDPFGSSTDSRILNDRINECTNISVGYFKAHSNAECQDLEFLKDLSNAFVRIDWEDIKSHRKFNASKNPNFGFNDFSYKKQQNLLYPPKNPTRPSKII